MGASGSAGLKINFNRPNLFYFAGETVQGDVILENSEEKLAVDAIYLECIGDASIRVTKTRIVTQNGSTGIRTYTVTVTKTIMNIRRSLVQPQNGQNEIILCRGQHSWPFQFQLADDLPPTLPETESSHSFVKYYVRVVIDKPWYKPNAQQCYNIKIFPRVNILYTPGGQQSVAFQNQNRGKIRLHGYLIRGGVVPRDKISLHIEIQNPKQGFIKRIEATFTQHRKIGPNNDTSIIFRTDVPDIRDFGAASLQKAFDLPIPSVFLPPTHTYYMQSNNGPYGVVVNYTLTLDVKTRGLFSDFKVTFPVIVGTEPMLVQQQQMQQPPLEVNVPFEMPIASAPVMEYDELPPSYDSIATTEKV